jgi:nucleotide-binding universal stress UspA family protein
MTSSLGGEQRRIVVGIDGSHHSEQALRWGAFLASTLGARIEAVSAWQFPVTYGWATPDWDPSKDAEQVLSDTLRRVFGEHRPASVRTFAREGGAAKVLLDACRGADMLVVGSRGHGGFVGLLLGSVSASVAEHASCPVMIIHGDQVPTSTSSATH